MTQRQKPGQPLQQASGSSRARIINAGFSLAAMIVLGTGIAGCGGAGGENQKPPGALPVKASLPSVYYYTLQLDNSEFEWRGPKASEDRIPANHAARALAYIGDAAVPAILGIARDEPRIDKFSLFDALTEIGIPMGQFEAEFYDGDVRAIREWWDANRDSTLESRTEYRESIGLPPPDVYDEMGAKRVK